MTPLQNLLALYSSEVGMDEELIDELLSRVRESESKDELEAVESEIRSYVGDEQFDWPGLLNTKHHTIIRDATRDDAIQFVKENIAARLWPDRYRIIFDD